MQAFRLKVGQALVALTHDPILLILATGAALCIIVVIAILISGKRRHPKSGKK